MQWHKTTSNNTKTKRVRLEKNLIIPISRHQGKFELSN